MFKKRPKFVVLWICLIFPILFLGMLAFSSTWRFPTLIPEFKDNSNFELMVSGDASFVMIFLRSVLISITVAIVSVATGFFIAKVIAFHKKRNLLLLLAYFPFALSPVVFAACLNYFFTLFLLSGTTPGVMIAQFIIVFPYAIILFNSHWGSGIIAYEQSAATLGGNAVQRFFRVTLPLSKNMLLIGFFQCFIISWFEFGLTNFIGMGQVKTLTVKVFQYIGEANIHLAAMSSLLLVIPPLLLLWANKKFVLRNY